MSLAQAESVRLHTKKKHRAFFPSPKKKLQWYSSAWVSFFFAHFYLQRSGKEWKIELDGWKRRPKKEIGATRISEMNGRKKKTNGAPADEIVSEIWELPVNARWFNAFPVASHARSACVMCSQLHTTNRYEGWSSRIDDARDCVWHSQLIEIQSSSSSPTGLGWLENHFYRTHQNSLLWRVIDIAGIFHMGPRERCHIHEYSYYVILAIWRSTANSRERLRWLSVIKK